MTEKHFSKERKDGVGDMAGGQLKATSVLSHFKHLANDIISADRAFDLF